MGASNSRIVGELCWDKGKGTVLEGESNVLLRELRMDVGEREPGRGSAEREPYKAIRRPRLPYTTGQASIRQY